MSIHYHNSHRQNYCSLRFFSPANSDAIGTNKTYLRNGENERTKMKQFTNIENYVDKNSTIMSVDIVTNGTKSIWFQIKQEENEEQRKKLASLCSEVNYRVKEKIELSLTNIILSEKNMIAYCPVPKVATTTWYHFFLRAGKKCLEMSSWILVQAVSVHHPWWYSQA